MCASSPPLRGSRRSCVRWTERRGTTNYGTLLDPASTRDTGRAEGISGCATTSRVRALHVGLRLAARSKRQPFLITITATSAAIHGGAKPHLASALLHHTDHRVTEAHYNRASSLSAAQSYREIIQGYVKD